MPNISFDIFFQDDIINITASRSGGSAPKVKPAWKVRTAPKLPPKEPPVPKAVAAFGPPKAKQLTESKPAAKSKEEKPAPKPKEAAKANVESKKPAEVKKGPKLKDAANAKAGAISNAVAGAISGTVATAGSLAGNTLSGVGNTINGVGQSIESNIRNYGDGAKDYGNYIKDWTKAPGARVATARNPLGLTDSPAINYNRPKTTPKKAIEAPKPSGTTTKSVAPPAKSSPAPHVGSGKVGTAKSVGAAKPAAGVKGGKPSSAVGPAQKPSNLSTPKTMPKTVAGKAAGGSKAASSTGTKAVQSRMSAKNPLGL